MTHTDANGEIVVLDSAGYGAVAVDRAVSIVAPPGIYAGISVFAGTPNVTGIYVDAPGARVVLRGLTINGQGGASIGIRLVQGAELHVEGCVVSGFVTGVQLDAGATSIKDTIVRSNQDDGIFVNGAPSAQLDGVLARDNYTGIKILGGGATTQVTARNTVVTRNRVAGVYVGSSGASLVVVDLDGVEIAANGHQIPGEGLAINVDMGSKAELTLARSVVARNKAAGVSANSFVGGIAHASVTDSTISGNYGDGIVGTGAGTTLIASGDTLTRNAGFGFKNVGGTFFTRTNNSLQSNFGGATSGAISTLGPL
jgi:hypothetical protein